MSRPIIWATPAHDEIVEVDHEEWVDDNLMDALDGKVTRALIIDEVEVDEDKDVSCRISRIVELFGKNPVDSFSISFWLSSKLSPARYFCPTVQLLCWGPYGTYLSLVWGYIKG